jgi:transposase
MQEVLMTEIRIYGWYYHPKKEKPRDAKKTIEVPPRFDTLKLDKDLFKYSCREFDVERLEIIPMRRYVGNLLNMKEVQAVVDVRGSLIPFFIERQKVEALRQLISKYASPSIRL